MFFLPSDFDFHLFRAGQNMSITRLRLQMESCNTDCARMTLLLEFGGNNDSIVHCTFYVNHVPVT
jgi:hypothetical protein